MSIKVGPLPNGGECLASCDIGKFNVQLLQDPPQDNEGRFSGYAVIYSFNQTRLDIIEYNQDEKQQASDDWELIRQVLTNANACLR